MSPSAKNSASEFHLLDLSEASRAVQKKEVSPVELTQACLARIEKLNPTLKAFITVTGTAALEAARKAEAEIARGEWKGPLHGIPLAVKDLVETAGVKTTAASAVLKDYVPASDAEVIRRLKSAGAILLGKLNLHEFAYGGSGIIGHFGPARNPWNTEHVTGGSSSGSAVAVAACLCYGAIGTDTAGSIRLPAAFCGITGLKPTYGLVSARGVIPLSWSLDHVGPMARTAADVALMLQAIAAYDPQDVASQKFPPVYYPSAMEESISSLRLGVARDYWNEVDGEIAAAVDSAVATLSKLTSGAQEVELPTETDRTLVRCEAYAYHQKFLAGSEKDYNPETLRRIRSGSDVTAPQYIHAQHELLQQRRQILQMFARVDLVMTPTTPLLAPTFTELQAAPDQLRNQEMIMLRNTRPFNVYGLPSLSLNCGFSKSGLPIGLQIIGAPGNEGIVLALAHAYQKQTNWHKEKPALKSN
ncbi:MAG: amidase [Candidatus Angelobacter sp.]